MNSRKFPSSGGSGGSIQFDERLGLRQRTVYADAHGHPHLYDNWRWDVLKACRPPGYDEERRLLYVAITRARDHVIYAAGETPNRFLEELPVEVEHYEPDVQPQEVVDVADAEFSAELPSRSGPRRFAPHGFVDEAVFDAVEDGRGPVFGSHVHEFAEAYARGEVDAPPDSEFDDEVHVARFIDTLEGQTFVEQDVWLPLDVDGERISLHGYVDLVHVSEEVVDVIDYKTDTTHEAEEEYRKQLSVYYQVVTSAFPDREVRLSIFYTKDDDQVPIRPHSREKLIDLVREKDMKLTPR